jgi:hypothetical protein
MRYGIIICSKCRNLKIVDLSNKTTKCQKCKKILKIDKIKILSKNNSQTKLRKIIGLLNAETDNKGESFKKTIMKIE